MHDEASALKGRYSVEEQGDGMYSVVDPVGKRRVFTGTKPEAWKTLRLIRRTNKRPAGNTKKVRLR